MATHIIDKARKYLDIIVNILQDELEITILEYSGKFDLLQFYETKSIDQECRNDIFNALNKRIININNDKNKMYHIYYSLPKYENVFEIVIVRYCDLFSSHHLYDEKLICPNKDNDKNTIKLCKCYDCEYVKDNCDISDVFEEDYDY